jgi:hypothetical protein
MPRIELTELERQKLAKAGADVRKPAGWQPIETAPKGNARFLIWDGEFVYMWKGWWLEGQIFAYKKTPPPIIPTHWMPLPEPPKE